jgi:hypothetical protein
MRYVLQQVPSHRTVPHSSLTRARDLADQTYSTVGPGPPRSSDPIELIGTNLLHLLDRHNSAKLLNCCRNFKDCRSNFYGHAGMVLGAETG